MEITILIDNEKEQKDLRCEHGLSILIEFKGKSILFDTGKTDAFIQNSKSLGKDLSQADFVVLSHGHYDHTGGLGAFLNMNCKAKVVMKKEALQSKWSKSTEALRDISLPFKGVLQKYQERIIWANETLELIPGFFVFSNIKRNPEHTFSDSFLFVKQEGKLSPDTFNDELFVTAINNQKLIVFTGCAHNGIENMLQTAVNNTKLKDIEFVVGGTHLNRASDEQIERTANGLKKFNIRRAVFNHCSGKHNVLMMNQVLTCEVEYGFTGNSYVI